MQKYVKQIDRALITTLQFIVLSQQKLNKKNARNIKIENKMQRINYIKQK